MSPILWLVVIIIIAFIVALIIELLKPSKIKKNNSSPDVSKKNNQTHVSVMKYKESLDKDGKIRYSGMTHVSDPLTKEDDGSDWGRHHKERDENSDPVITDSKESNDSDLTQNNPINKQNKELDAENAWLDYYRDDDYNHSHQNIKNGSKSLYKLTKREWLEPFRDMPSQVILDMHCDLMNKIKKHYKLRAEEKQLLLAIDCCERSITLSRLTIEAMKKNNNESSIILGKEVKFFYPEHLGYKQYAVILKKQKQFEKLAVIMNKKEAEGWGIGDNY